MWYVYILKSERNGGYYIGSTNDIERRVEEHEKGKTKSTKYLRPLKLVFKEIFTERVLARRREQYLMKMKSREYIEKLIRMGE